MEVQVDFSRMRSLRSGAPGRLSQKVICMSEELLAQETWIEQDINGASDVMDSTKREQTSSMHPKDEELSRRICRQNNKDGMERELKGSIHLRNKKSTTMR